MKKLLLYSLMFLALTGKCYSAISWTDKNTGDDLTAADINEVKAAVDLNTLKATNTDDQLGSEVEMSEIGTATYDDVQDWINNTQSSGKISGGTFTTNGDGSCTVAAGTGFIRATNSELAEVLNFAWAEDATVSLTDNNTNYIYVDYNAGTPDVKSTTTKTTANNRDKILLGKIYREGTTLHEVEAGMVVSELARRVLTYLNGLHGEIVRFRGLVTTEVGDLGLAITEGAGAGGLTPLSWSAIDTTGADDFRLWYNDSAWQDSVVSVIETAQYNNYGTGLANYSNNNFGTFYVYMHFEGDVHVVYGIDSYATLGEAELAPTPANLPALVSDFSLYIGKIIIQQGATTDFIDVRYPWADTTTTGLTSDHGALSGLGDDDHPQYEDELTNSAGLLAALSDETGTGVAVFAASPTLVTPTLGAATATSLTIPGTSSGGQVATFLEDTDNAGSNYVGIGAPSSITNNLILLLPQADPTTGQIMTCAAPSSVTFSDGVARNASVCTWTADAGGAETNSLETLTTDILENEIPIGKAGGDAVTYGTNLPTATTIGSAYVYRVGGTDVADADIVEAIARDSEVEVKYVSGTEADFYGTFIDPDAVYTVTPSITIANIVPAAFTITEISIACDADPTTEITMTFNHKAAGVGYGTPTTIEAVTTTNGTATITSGIDDATISAGVKMFVTLSDPDDALKECAWQIEGDWD